MMSLIYILPILPQQQRLLLWQALIYCYLLTSYAITASNNEFNNQIMPRILETIDNYVNQDHLWNIKNYRDLGTFEYGFTIADHTLLAALLLSADTTFSVSVTEYLGWFLALEDGTYFYTSNPPLHGIQIRGPGQSGYKVLDAKRSDHPYHKHLISCVNETNGEPKDCIADVGQKYIECVNDCELIPCSNTSTNNNNSYNNSNNDNSTTTSNNDNTTDTSNENSDDILSLLPKWCSNYIVKEVQPEEEGLLGYIPRTIFCVNVNGQPEQRPGYVLTVNKTLGNCYYQDGITMVNRTFSGQYAFCGPNKTCNAFAGGYDSDAYDPRFRPWYIEAKLAQRASFGQPFVAYEDNDIGFQYTLPLYNYQNTETGSIQASLLNEIANSNIVDDISLRYRQIFAGVLVHSVRLTFLTQFLVGEYANTTMRVFIVEQNPNVNGTNYMISSSTGQNIKHLLLSNLSQPCPEESFSDTNVCTVERLSIQELGGFYVGGSSNTTHDDDLIFYRAFMEFEKLNFPTTRQINFRVNEADVYSKAFVGQTQTYHQPNNLDWRVFVVLPMDRSTNDAVTVHDPSFACICVFASVGLVGCLVLLISFFQKRTEKAVINADWRFTCAFIFGCAILNLSTFTMLGENTNPMCMLRMWSFNALFVSALSPLFVKVWRMSKLLMASTGFKRTSVSNFQAFLYTLPFIAIEIIILSIFSFVDPPRQTEELGVGVGIGVQQITCQQRTNAFFITQITYCSILLFIGCVLAYRTRNLDPKYGEAKQLGFSMYNITFTGIVVVLVIKLVNIDTATQIILQAVSILWGSFFCSLAFVLPRLLEASKDRRLIESRKTSHNTTSNSPKPTNAVTSHDTTSQHLLLNNSNHNNTGNNNIDYEINFCDMVEGGDDIDYESKPLNDHTDAITPSHEGTLTDNEAQSSYISANHLMEPY